MKIVRILNSELIIVLFSSANPKPLEYNYLSTTESEVPKCKLRI